MFMYDIKFPTNSVVPASNLFFSLRLRRIFNRPGYRSISLQGGVIVETLAYIFCFFELKMTEHFYIVCNRKT